MTESITREMNTCIFKANLMPIVPGFFPYFNPLILHCDASVLCAIVCNLYR